MADGVELTTAYVSVTISARGIEAELERQVGRPLQQVAARSSDLARRQIEQQVGAVKIDAARAIGQPIEAAATRSAGNARTVLEAQLARVDTSVVSRALSTGVPTAAQQAGALARAGMEREFARAGAGAGSSAVVASLTKPIEREAAAAGAAAKVSFARAFTTGVADADLKRISTGALVFSGATAVGLNALATAASDYGESQNKANVILGVQGSRAAETYAASAVKTAGISKQAALDATTLFAQLGKAGGLKGDKLTQFGTELTQLAGDLASFSNTSVDQAITAIGAGLRGESEPLRQYGVLLDEATLKARAMALGISDGTGTLTAQQRVLAAQAEILRQTSDAQGDFARTAGSAANRQRQAAAEAKNVAIEVGQALVPLKTAGLSGILALLKGFEALPGPIKTSTVAAAALTAGLAAVGGVGLKVREALSFFDSTKSATAAARAPQIVAEAAATQGLAGAQTEAAGTATLMGGAEGEAAVGTRALGTAAATTATEVEGLAAAQTQAATTSRFSATGIGLVGTAATATAGAIAIAGLAIDGYNKSLEKATKYRTFGDTKSLQATFDPTLAAGVAAVQRKGILDAAADVVSGRDKSAAGPTNRFESVLDSLGIFKLGTLGGLNPVANIPQINQAHMAEAEIKRIGEAVQSMPLAQGRQVLDEFNKALVAQGLDAKVVTELLGKYSHQLDVTEAANRAANTTPPSSIQSVTDAVKKLSDEQALAAVNSNALAAGQKAFSDSLDRADAGLTSRIASALNLRTARQSFTEQLANLPKTLDPSAIALGGDTTVTKLHGIEVGIKGIDQALTKMSEKQKLATLQWDAMQAGAKGFTDSLDRSSGLNSLLAGAIGISDAVTSFREGLNQLPHNPDPTALIRDAFNQPLATKAGVGLNSADHAPTAAEPFISSASLTPAASDGSPTKSLQSVLALASASRSFLAQIIQLGEGERETRANADLLRESFDKQLRSVGLTSAEVAKYNEILGLTPGQISKAISVAGIEEARTKVTSLLALYRDKLPTKLATKIAIEIDRGTTASLNAAAADLLAFGKSGAAAATDISKAQGEALQTVLQLGQSTKAYLASLVGAGQVDLAKAEAARLRDDFLRQLAGVGITGKAAQTYLDALGLNPDSLKKAFDDAGVATHLSKLEQVLQLEGNISEKWLHIFETDVVKGQLDQLDADVSKFLADQKAKLANGGLFGANPAAPTGAGGPLAPNRPGLTPGTPPHLPLAPAAPRAPLPPALNPYEATGRGFPALALPGEEHEWKGVKYRFDGLAVGVGKWVPHYATGGLVADVMNRQLAGMGGKVRGPGVGDVIDTKLDPREYVLRPEATAHYGVNFLNAMNAMEVPVKKFATGGFVGDAPAMGPTWEPPTFAPPTYQAPTWDQPASRGSGLAERPIEVHTHLHGTGVSENQAASATARGLRDGAHQLGI
jgi:hypothetical protein